jgi:hypothetical protein
MSFECPVPLCKRTFSLRSAYTQHVKKCVKKLELESDSDSSSNSEHYENEVIFDFTFSL